MTQDELVCLAIGYQLGIFTWFIALMLKRKPKD